MTKPLPISLARRFAHMAALLAGIAMLAIAGASWWMINQEHAASLHSLLKKDAALQATSVSSKLHVIAARMSELTKSSLITNALRDSVDKDRILIPYLKGIQDINGVPVDIAFTDFEGREIARNGNASFSEQELSWLREKLPAGQPTARVQLGKDGKESEELLAVEFIVFSHSNVVEGALLYRIKLDELALHTMQSGVRLMHGKESEPLLHSQAAIATAVNVPPIYKLLDFAILTSPDPSARSVDWQTLGVFFILAVGMVVTVIMLGLNFGKRLTRDLLGLEFFARGVSESGFGTGRAEAADSLEVASLAQSINGMLDHLEKAEEALRDSEMMSRNTTESMVEGVITTTTENIVLEANAAALQLFGYEKSELIGRDVSELVPERHRRQYKDTVAALAAQPEAFRIPGRELRSVRKDGSEFLASVSFADIQVGGRRLFTAVILDITEHKRVEVALRESETRFRNLTELSSDWYWEQDVELRLSFHSSSFAERSGTTSDKLLGKCRWEEPNRFPLNGTWDEHRATLEARQPFRDFEYVRIGENGEQFFVSLSGVPIYDAAGNFNGYRGVGTNITERKQAQNEILLLNTGLEQRVQERTEELESQQEELRQSNEELEEKNHLLAEQKVEVEHKNREIEASRLTLAEKAEQLALTSKYKSEFLSSMSHELRTPLNSLLILAQLLAENAEHNMSGQQIEYAKTIQGAGKDLLALINDILDLSKIESGTVTLDLDDVSFANVGEQLEQSFCHVAQSRSLGFDVELAPSLPPSLYTDSQRLQQVLKNLLSNAFKFTQKGQVSVRIAAVESGWSVDHDGLNRAQTVIGFFVTDSGIGLATDKQKIIFEAFQQADTGTTRKYGGTGLGLSISRELARLLGGELHLAMSSPGQGSTFVLYLPLRAPESGQNSSPATQEIMPLPETSQEIILNSAIPVMVDDRAAIKPGERTLLIIEDDARFAAILLRAARDKGFKGIVAARGDDGLKLAGEFKPTAITLDLHLPDMDGWVVLERLKRNPDTRHIPVEIISAEDNRPRGLRDGAFEYLVKPVTAESLHKALADVNKFAEREVKDLLVADGNEQHRNSVLDLIGNGDVRIKAVASGKDALAALKKKRYDCIVLDFNLPDISVADLLEAIQGIDLTRDVPVIIYGMDELPQQEQERLKSLTLKGIVKEVRTPERLLDETALFLHRVVSKLPEERRQMLEKLYLSADSLAGKKVLVVDDDVRNIFALTALLERHKMAVLSAENGRAALEELGQNPDVDIVLMDIMMPEMDGYEAMRQIRQMKQFESLPMIALTAKAMQGDREKCIAAGASDYVSKPVDTDQLVSLLRVWLYR